MTAAAGTPACRSCGIPVDPAGPVIAVAGANGFDGNAFIPFVEEAETLGTAGVIHIDCFVSEHGRPALAELIHAPKARAMEGG
jgi:hypothetical protein